MDKLPEIEIGGKTFVVDVSKVTIQDWQKLTEAMAGGNSNQQAEQLIRIVLMTLPKGTDRLSILFFPLIIPRVMQLITQAILPMDVETEIEEILRMRDEN